MQANKRADASLHSLERWRTSLLEQAQTEHLQRQKISDEHSRAVNRVQSTIDDSHALARTQMIEGRILSVDALTRVRHFTAIQSVELRRANESLQHSQQETASAHKQVCKKFEELAVVERLRERRLQEATKEAARQEQNRLDEQALLRSKGSLVIYKHRNSELGDQHGD